MNARCSLTTLVLVVVMLLTSCVTAPKRSASGTAAPGGAQQTMGRSTGSLVEVPFDPSSFVAEVDNPFFPLVRGTVYTYFDGLDSEKVEVTRDHKTILGVAVTVVHDRQIENGEVLEDTFDWYAQDRDGNVWYMGEATKTLSGGQVVSTEGSWQAGVDGAQAGIIMLGQPEVGDGYRQEYSPGVAEDQAKVLSLDESVPVIAGTFTACLETGERTALEPGDREFKYYARGVGTVLEVAPKDEHPRNELVGISRR